MNMDRQAAEQLLREADKFAADVQKGGMAPGALDARRKVEEADRKRVEESSGILSIFLGREEPFSKEEISWRAEAEAIPHRRQEAEFLAAPAESAEAVARTGAFNALVRQEAVRLAEKEGGQAEPKARERGHEAVQAALDSPDAAAALLGKEQGQKLTNLDVLKAASVELGCSAKTGAKLDPASAMAAMKEPEPVAQAPMPETAPSAEEAKNPEPEPLHTASNPDPAPVGRKQTPAAKRRFQPKKVKLDGRQKPAGRRTARRAAAAAPAAEVYSAAMPVKGAEEAAPKTKAPAKPEKKSSGLVPDFLSKAAGGAARRRAKPEFDSPQEDSWLPGINPGD